jgi:(S)-citramalyl-CoA lyase
MSAWLFCPGDDLRKLRKALSSEAEVVIIDWEDGVAAERKAVARTTTAAALAERGRPRVMVRVNHPASDHGPDDAAAVRDLPVDGLLIPKWEEAGALEPFTGAGPSIVPLVESARGLQAVAGLAAARAQVERVAFGCLDLCVDLGVRWSAASPLLTQVRAQLVVHSRTVGLAPPIDGVYPALRDVDGLRRDARAAREMGFAGKLAVHPEQISPIADGFGADDDEIAWARRVVSTMAAAGGTDGGEAVRVIDGELVDAPVVSTARRLLATAELRRDD